MMTTAHAAIVTGANHGIGAATAKVLAQRGCAVLCTFLRVEDQADPGTPQAYRENRAQDAGAVVAAIQAAGSRALAVEADLSDPATPAMLFDTAEEQLGPVSILVNNATGWVSDTFAPASTDRHGRSLQPVTAATWGQQFAVDTMAAAMLISEFAAAINLSGSVTGVYAVIGGLTAAIALAFAFSPVAHGDRYLAAAAQRRAGSAGGSADGGRGADGSQAVR